jgi:hypothetical protein
VRAPRVAILCGRLWWSACGRERYALRRRHDRHGRRARREFSHAGWHRPEPPLRAQRPVSDVVTSAPPVTGGGTVINFVVCLTG